MTPQSARSHRLAPIFNFNHVSEKLTIEEINELKAYYKTYHKNVGFIKKLIKNTENGN